MPTYDLETLPGEYAVCRLAPGANPEVPKDQGLVSITHTSDETSLVCLSDLAPIGCEAEFGWRGFRVAGRLPFLQVGVISEISAALSRAGVPIFAVSTFDTDYFFVQQSDSDRALDALDRAGHRVFAEAWLGKQ